MSSLSGTEEQRKGKYQEYPEGGKVRAFLVARIDQHDGEAEDGHDNGEDHRSPE